MAATLNTIEFLEPTNSLWVNFFDHDSDLVKLTILNHSGETIKCLSLTDGRQQIDVTSLPDGKYSIRLVAGENVLVRNIHIHHAI